MRTTMNSNTPEPTPADVVFFNGKIATQDDKRSFADALAVAIPYIPFIAKPLGFTSLPPAFLLVLVVMVITYLALAELTQREGKRGEALPWDVERKDADPVYLLRLLLGERSKRRRTKCN